MCIDQFHTLTPTQRERVKMQFHSHTIMMLNTKRSGSTTGMGKLWSADHRWFAEDVDEIF